MEAEIDIQELMEQISKDIEEYEAKLETLFTFWINQKTMN